MENIKHCNCNPLKLAKLIYQLKYIVSIREIERIAQMETHQIHNCIRNQKQICKHFINKCHTIKEIINKILNQQINTNNNFTILNHQNKIIIK